MRVFVGCSDIAGFQSRAARALARAGHEVRYLNVSPHRYNPELPDDSGVIRVLPSAFGLASRLREKGGLRKSLGSCLRAALLWIVLLTSLPRTKVYIFAGRRSFFSSCFDLCVLRVLGKRVIHFFMGSDSRPAYLGSFDGGNMERSITPRELERLAKRVVRQKRRMKTISRNVSEMSDNPLCGHFHLRRYINWYRIGFPLSTAAFRVEERLEEAAREEGSKAVRILHCPSKLGTKGTKEIDACIERLRGDGLAIDYIRITKMPHAEVLDQLARCNFVVDQLYSDSALSGFATEAAMFGKPAVIGGWGWDILDATVPRDLLPPSARCRPEDLDATVKRLVVDENYRRRLGRAARSFVDENWSEEAFAERLAVVMEGKVPEDWYFEPDAVKYVEGCGMPEEMRRELLRSYLEMLGPGALGLSGRDGLQEAIEAFAKGGDSES